MKTKTLLSVAALALALTISGCAESVNEPDPAKETAAVVTTAAATEVPETSEPAPATDAAPSPRITKYEIRSNEDTGRYVEGIGYLKEGDAYAFYADKDAAYTYADAWRDDILLYLPEAEWETELDTAFRLYGLTVADLDEAGIEYIRYEKGTPEYDEYYAPYHQRMTDMAFNNAVGNYARTGWKLPLAFEPGEELSDDDLIEFFMFVVLPSKVAAGEYKEYKNEDGSFDIPVEVYEAELTEYFDVVFNDNISENQSQTTPRALNVRLPRVTEGGSYVTTYGEPETVDGVLVYDCYVPNYGYQELFSDPGTGEDVFTQIAAVTFRLGVVMHSDYQCKYLFCRDLTEHYYTLDDFASIVPGRSTLDDLLALTPEAVVSDPESNSRTGKLYVGYSMGNEEDSGRILVTLTPDGVVESITQSDHLS